MMPTGCGRIRRPGARPPGCHAVYAGHLPELLLLGLSPPSGPRRRPGLGPRLAGWRRAGTVAVDDRHRLDPPPDLRAGQAGRDRIDRHGERGYYPLLACMAGTGDVLHSRLQEGVTNSGVGRAASWLRGRFAPFGSWMVAHGGGMIRRLRSRSEVRQIWEPVVDRVRRTCRCHWSARPRSGQHPRRACGTRLSPTAHSSLAPGRGSRPGVLSKSLTRMTTSMAWARNASTSR
jgi:hypothetical protein